MSYWPRNWRGEPWHPRDIKWPLLWRWHIKPWLPVVFMLVFVVALQWWTYKHPPVPASEPASPCQLEKPKL